jgi:hypothetical protein
MSSQVPTFAGWYPDSETGGTKYWDGSRWTGDRRPRRRQFAAAASHRKLIPLILMGGGSYGAICVGAAFEDDFSIGWFLFGIVTLIAVVLSCVYTCSAARGRRPRRFSSAWPSITRTSRTKEEIRAFETGPGAR